MLRVNINSTTFIIMSKLKFQSYIIKKINSFGISQTKKITFTRYIKMSKQLNVIFVIKGI